MKQGLLKKYVNEWITVLRSGKFKQAKGKLQRDEGYCCLGVACELFADKYTRGSEGFLHGETPRTAFGAPGWLEAIGSEQFNGALLADLNDRGLNIPGETKVKPLTFDEIADILQLKYIEGAKFED